MNDSPSKQVAPFGLRMPPDLKERVAKAAEAANRSMNAEIVAVLEQRYPAPVVLSSELEAYITSLGSVVLHLTMDEVKEAFEKLVASKKANDPAL